MAKSFGTGDYYLGATATTYGTISNYSEDDVVEIAVGTDGDGNVDAYNTFNRAITCTMDLETDGTLPKAGDVIAATLAQEGSKNVVIESVNNTQVNNGVSTASIVGKYWPDNDIPS